MQTIRDLITALEGLAAEHGDDIGPRLVTGMRDPQQFAIQDVDVVEVDAGPDGTARPKRRILYLVPEPLGEMLAAEAQRALGFQR